jgi:uncharacterized protein YcnI
MTIRLIPAALVATLLLAAPAAAHVTVSPDTVKAGSFKKLEIRVPSESPTENIVEVSVQMPGGVTEVEALDLDGGWSADVEEEGGEVRTVTWTGGRIAPNAVLEFPIRVRIPRGADDLTFKAVERYDGGKVSRWIGAPDSANPAPVVTVSGSVAESEPAEAVEPEPDAEPTATTTAPAPEEPTGGTEAPAETPSADVAPEQSDDDDDGGGLAVVAIVLAVLALAGGAAAVVKSRRTTP